MSLWRSRRSVGLPRTIDHPIAVPNFYGGVAGGKEQNVRTGLRLGVAIACDQVGGRDMVAGIKEMASIVRHGHTGSARGITSTSGADHAMHTGLAKYDTLLFEGSRVNSTGARRTIHRRSQRMGWPETQALHRLAYDAQSLYQIYEL